MTDICHFGFPSACNKIKQTYSHNREPMSAIGNSRVFITGKKWDHERCTSEGVKKFHFYSFSTNANCNQIFYSKIAFPL
jgi:hypothetical protein